MSSNDEQIKDMIKEFRNQRGRAPQSTVKRMQIEKKIHDLLYKSKPSDQQELIDDIKTQIHSGPKFIGYGRAPKNPYDNTDLTTMLKLKENVLLNGPSGTGKTYFCLQYAKQHNITNIAKVACYEMMSDAAFIGYNDINGNYHPSSLYKAYKEGGLLIVDEIDAADSNTLLVINQVLDHYPVEFANGEVVKCHPDFICICTSNDYMGIDSRFNRNRLDAATIDRLYIYKVDPRQVQAYLNYEVRKEVSEKLHVDFKSLLIYSDYKKEESYRSKRRSLELDVVNNMLAKDVEENK